MKKFSRLAILSVLGLSLVAPLFALAAGINTALIKSQYSDPFIGVINTILVPVLMAIAFIVFLYGIFRYFIYGAASDTDRATGRQFALWGIIGFVIILSLWGIINLFMGTLGLSVGQAPPYPTIGGSTGVTTGNNGTTNLGNGTIGGTGNVFNSNGTLLGRVDSSGNIISSNGQIVGRVQNGQAVDTSGTPISGATLTNTGSSSQCEASGGVWSVSSNACLGGSGSTNSSSGSSAYQTCIANDGDPQVCQCEANGGVWSLTDQACSTGSGSTNNGTTGSDSCSTDPNPPACQCEAGGGAWNFDGTCDYP